MQAHARKVVAVLVFATLVIRQIKQSLTVEEDFDLPTEVEKVGTKWNGKKNAATFLGMELAFVPEAKPSVVHCVGDNFLPKTSAGYRSCQFRQLCFSLSKKEFVIFSSEQDQLTLSLLRSMDSRYVRASFEVNNISVATSATSENRLRQGIDGDWFPSPLVAKHLHNNSGFYQLPDDVVLLPVYFPEDGSMPRKDVLFDFFLPIFNLLSMFELQDKKLLLANLRSSSCTSANATLCYKGVMEFLPLMNKDFNQNNAFLDVAIHKINDFEGGHLGNGKHRPNYICARFGAAGIGALTEHGIHKKSHGERIKDYTFVHNSGRGKLLFDFRNHLLGNMGMKRAEDKAKNDIPAKITISISQSKRSGVHDFREQLRAIQSHFPKDQVHVQEYNMLELPLTTQLEIASETSIFISVMGDGALPAFFLPWGATLILFYNDESEFASATKSEKTFPVKLDWDLWNNLSHIRVHWLPLGGKNGAEDLDMLLELISTTLNSKRHTPDRNTGYNRSGKPDGTFNGVDVHFVDGRNQSSTCHCVGENFQDEAQTFRSCQFQYMCLDLNSEHRNFSLAVSRQQSELMHSIEKRDTSPAFVSTSTTGRSSMMIGHTIRFHQGSGWFPVSSNVPRESFYEISGDFVWVPFYAEQPNINNPGHLVWDYFMPFFNLLAIFGLEDHQLLLSNIDDSCSPDADNPCWGLMTKFLPLLGVDPSTFQSTRTSLLNINGGSRRSSIVCARNAVAGIGFLTDHGWNRHGQRIEDYRDVHNVGRGPTFYAFRKFVTKKMGVREQDFQGKPHKVVFSKFSSKNPSRRVSFEKQIQAVRTAFSNDLVVVEEHVLSELSLSEQVQLATETSVFVSVVGGSACTASFLPRGSSVILFFNDVNEFTGRSPRKDFPSMIDWDWWENASYLQVQWLPMRTMNLDIDLRALTEVIRGVITNRDALM